MPLAFETLAAAGSALGTGAVIVMDETTDMVEVTRRITSFFAHESCGRCMPCRIGGKRMLERLDRMVSGKGLPTDLQDLERLSRGIAGVTFCPMGTGMCEPVASGLRLFGGEFAARVRAT